MRRRLFTILSALSLAIAAWLVIGPKALDAHRYWILTPIGEFGPYEKDSNFLPLLFLSLIVLPLLWAADAIRHRLRPRPIFGHCAHCVYDLRATPDRCPECGTETKTLADTAGGNRTT
jgi:hypothetical protein